jgi:hypothetical protein|nr:MAG TPA: hypothetical protein [Caudoviricetes sp.]
MTTKIKIPEFDFLKGQLIQTRALRALSHRCRYENQVGFLYEIIESLPPAQNVEIEKLYSSRNESGYVEKYCIGQYIAEHKVEADYYKYLQANGRKYSDYLKEVKEQERKQNEIDDREQIERDKTQKEEREKEAIESNKREEQKILYALNTGEQEYVESSSMHYKNVVKRLEEERKTKSVVEQLNWYKEQIPTVEARALDYHRTINRVYELSSDEISPKFKYEVGDVVYYTLHNAGIKTKVVEIHNNIYGTTYRVKEAEGIVNCYVDYTQLLPEREFINTNTESLKATTA